LIAATVFDFLDGQVQAIRTAANPDKLRHLGRSRAPGTCGPLTIERHKALGHLV
jgi:hypothetical protein